MIKTYSPQSESERRVATILFADISGFTAMSERLEPEEVTDLMNACFEAIGRVVEHQSGIIDKYIGDCAMILFGAPRTVEGAPDKALRAALEIREAIERINAELRPPVVLRVHSGVNTGTVIAGRVGSKDSMAYTVMGDPVNVASRLKDTAEPGQILVGRETCVSLRENYAFGQMRTVAAKGKASGIEAWELLSVTPARNAPAIQPDRTGLIGRDAEQRLLERRALQAESGEGSILILSGEAGIGKTRLVDELLGSKAVGGCLALVGRCQPDGSKRSFHPFAEAFRAWTGEKPSDSTRLQEILENIAPGDADVISPPLARMFGLTLSEEDEKKLTGIDGENLERLTFACVKTLISRLAESKPLVFVIEDLHFADASSLDLIESCLHLTVMKPIFFLLTVRPYYPDATRWSMKILDEQKGARATEIRLSSLDSVSSGRLVDALGGKGELDPNLRRKIVEKSGGNPQFIEELVRSLPEGTELPSSIGEAVMCRIDRLDPEARDILKTASVAGRRVEFRVLRTVLPQVDDLHVILARLVSAGILAERANDGNTEYLFVREVVRDVAYSSIISGRRKDLHRSIAEAIERINADRLDDVAGLLALHYSRAELFDKAEACMIRAGESASKAAAANEAISHYRDALEICLAKGHGTADPARIDSIEMSIAKLLYAKGRYREALPFYERLLERRGYPAKGSPARAAMMTFGLVRILGWILFPNTRKSKHVTPDIIEIQDLVWEYGGILGATGEMKLLFLVMGVMVNWFLPYGLRDSDALLAGIISFSFLSTWTGIFLPFGRRILRITRPFVSEKSTRSRIVYLDTEEAWGIVTGDYTKRSLFRDLLVRSVTDRSGLYYVFHILYHACTMSLETGDWATFNEARTQLEETTERFDADVGRGCLENNKIRYLLKRRDLEESERAVLHLVDFFARTGYQAFRALDFASRIALMKGDLAGAIAEFDRAEKAWAGHGGVLIGDGLHFGASAALAVERAREAAASGHAALAFRRDRAAVRRYLANSRRFAPDLPEALKFAGCFAWHSGRQERAMEFWRRSIAAAERFGAKVELAHTLSDAGELLGERLPGPEWRERGASLHEALGIRH